MFTSSDGEPGTSFLMATWSTGAWEQSGFCAPPLRTHYTLHCDPPLKFMSAMGLKGFSPTHYPPISTNHQSSSLHRSFPYLHPKTFNLFV